MAIYGKTKRVYIRNNLGLITKLSDYYEKHLKRELGLAEYLLLKILINLLQSQNLRIDKKDNQCNVGNRKRIGDR